jgi:membrane-bound lytic murein transglycosylase D
MKIIKYAIALGAAGVLILGCSSLSPNKAHNEASKREISPASMPSKDNATAATSAPDDQASGLSASGMQLPPENQVAYPLEIEYGKTAVTAEPAEDTVCNSNNPGPKQAQSMLDEALDFCEVSQAYWQKGELESALEALDKGYSLILDVDTKQEAKLIQQKEDLRFLISKRILEIYASRNIVVNGNHDEIPIALNRHVRAELNRFSGKEKNFFIESYKRSGRYRPFILEALEQAGLPEELSWLPLIESGFKVRALSRARALGLWQFIPSTGYKFGLKRDQFVDERLDFVKATHAAIAYLKELHNIFGDWATVLAAYNCGEGRVLQVIRTQNINYLDNFWDLYERLPLETARYVPRFYAVLHMVKNPGKYGIEAIGLDDPLVYDEIEINRGVHLKDISQVTGISLSELKDLNPELRYQIVPPQTYSLRIPQGSNTQWLAKIDTIPVSQPPRTAYIRHRVRRGETLSTIARRYHTSVNRIMRANNLRRSNLIRAGHVLKIPQRGYASAAAATPKSYKRASHSGTHYVRKGDSLWIIAKRYGTTVQQIQAVNGLNSSVLSIGQALKIPGYKPDPLPDTAKLSTYYVKRGDSPYTIAQKHNMPLGRLLLINKLHPRSRIYPGQKLYIE